MKHSETKDFANLFQTVRDDLLKDLCTSDEIRIIAREVDELANRIYSAMEVNLLKSDFKDKHMPQVVEVLESKVKDKMSKIASLVEPRNFYKYHELFRIPIQNLVFVILFSYYLDNKSLMDRQSTASLLSLKLDPCEGAHLDLEDYLHAVLKMISNLVRHAMNAFVAGDVTLPFEISEFVSAMDSNFRLLNLKNDGLRRKFDSLKYDAQKCEQMIFDLTLRGFKKA